MAVNRKDIIKEKKWKGILTKRGKEIFELYFFNEMSQKDIRNKLNEKEKVRDSQVLYNLVSDHTNAWEELGYLKKRKIPNPESKSKFHPNKDVYYATIKPFFDYTKDILSILSVKEKIKRGQLINIPEKLKKKFRKEPKLTKEEIKEYEETEFDEIEKEILEHIFSIEQVRKIVFHGENLFEESVHFLERIFFYKTELDWPHSISHFFRKSFFSKNKKYVKLTKEIYLDKLEEIKEFEKISMKYFRKLRTKIKIISNFSDQDYFNLTITNDLRKYQYMPSYKEIMEEKDKIKRHMLVRRWIQLYFFDEIPEGFK